MTYDVEVRESVIRTCTLRIEAGSPDEAAGKALAMLKEKPWEAEWVGSGRVIYTGATEHKED